ncbi:hypothetical protein LJC13_00150 [Peptostreptococcaceae bacterium OttesenSCG-928-C18]|nr:hypothetical protein [Peptostreptococcaceae bacterium OttesenSCG-928-C18]
MKINFNVTGSERKALVMAMGEILEVKPRYLGMPSAAYEVGNFTVDKNGAIAFDDGEDIGNLLANLAQKGFVAEESINPPTAEAPPTQRRCGANSGNAKRGIH